MRFVSSQAETLLGWQPTVEGVTWIERYVIPSMAESARSAFRAALTGALGTIEVEVRTGREDVRAQFSSVALGQEDRIGLLLTLDKTTPTGSRGDTLDYEYVVSGIASESYQLESFSSPAPNPPPSAQGKCHEILHGRKRPCDRCPLRPEPGERAIQCGTNGADGYLLLSAHRLGADSARVRARRISNSSMTAMIHARVDHLATRGRLSKREHAVFRELMEGHLIHDIACALGISSRTVKFHQANLLQKLGADSRADLLRLLF